MANEEKKDNSSLFAIIMFGTLALGVVAVILKLVLGF